MEVRVEQGLNSKWGIAESPKYVYVDTGADWNLKSITRDEFIEAHQ